MRDCRCDHRDHTFSTVYYPQIEVFHKLTWVYAGVGLVLLSVVAVLGARSYGAKLSFSFGGISIQPSEFIKNSLCILCSLDAL